MAYLSRRTSRRHYNYGSMDSQRARACRLEDLGSNVEIYDKIHDQYPWLSFRLEYDWKRVQSSRGKAFSDEFAVDMGGRPRIA